MDTEQTNELAQVQNDKAHPKNAVIKEDISDAEEEEEDDDVQLDSVEIGRHCHLCIRSSTF